MPNLCRELIFHLFGGAASAKVARWLLRSGSHTVTNPLAVDDRPKTTGSAYLLLL
jgi:hypothetical protein